MPTRSQSKQRLPLAILTTCFSAIGEARTTCQAQPSPPSAPAQPVYFWSNGTKQILHPSKVWVSARLEPSATPQDLLPTLSGAIAMSDDTPSVHQYGSNVVAWKLNSRIAHSSVELHSFTSRLANKPEVHRVLRAFENGSLPPIVETEEFLVQFKPCISDADIKALLSQPQYQADIVRPLGDYAPNAFLARVRDPERQSAIQVADSLYEREKDKILFAHPNFLWPVQQHEDASPNSAISGVGLYTQWHLQNQGEYGGVPGADVRALLAWEITRGSPTITIAILDDGVDMSHPDLLPNLVPGRDVLTNTDLNPGDSPPTSDPYWGAHGTPCAGLATAPGATGVGVTGVAPGCKLMPVRMIGPGTTPERWAAAIDWAVDHRADVISNSWGPDLQVAGLQLDVVFTAIKYAVHEGRNKKGCVVLFSAGNDRKIPVDPHSFAASSDVICVASSTNQDVSSWRSSPGSAVSLCAPSDGGTLNVVTTDRTGSAGRSDGDYTSTGPDGFGGTSAATPIVAGVSALLLSAEPNLTAEQVRQRLEQTADKIDPMGGAYDIGGRSNKYGYGRVNAYHALLNLPTPSVKLNIMASATLARTYQLRATTANDADVAQVDFDERPFTSFYKIPNYPIMGPDPITDGVVITADGTIGEASLTVSVDSTARADFKITLITPEQRHITVLDWLNGGNTDVISMRFDLTGQLAGTPIQGEWRLEVDNALDGAAATLQAWGMTLEQPWHLVSSATGQVSGQWQTEWNTSSVPTAAYEVRAIALPKQGDFDAYDMSTSVLVPPIVVGMASSAGGAGGPPPTGQPSP